jgi:hypothetical protein
LPLGRYRALGLPATLTTSRGCPYQCIFCVGRKMGGERNLKLLIDRIIPAQNADRDVLESALVQAFANGNLKCHAKDGKVKWQWQDYLRSTHFKLKDTR